MRLIILCGLVALALAGSGRLQQWNNEAEPFRSGKQYRFRYESQISSGLGNVEQVSAHRISAIVNVNFETERVATLQLQNIRIGALNQPIEEPRKIQPARLFNEKEIDGEFLEQLEKPIKFDYVDGLVERVFFHQKESSWTKNIKRAVLNMLQLNLKRRESNLQGYDWEQLRNNEDDKTTQSRMFTLPENTLEGECQTVYTINKVNEQTSEEHQLFNVTKSIDFKHCKKVASIRYGPRVEKPTFESEQREIESNELDRSTVLRFQLTGTQDKYAIGRVELLSQYVYKTLNAEHEQPLQTVVVAELALESVQSQDKKNVAVSEKEESLIYSTEWDKLEKRFFQYGDEEFSRQSSPFAKVQNKVQIAKSLIKRIAQDSHDKTNGISNESPLKLQQLVEIVRMCSVPELKQIHEQITESKIEQTIFMDTLAIAGTRNTIHFIVEAALKQEITPSKTVQALQQLSGVPVVSSKQVEQIFRLCKSEVAQRSGPLRQACWLTAGSLIGDLCKENTYETVEESEKQCPRDIKEKFQKTLINEYKQAETTYEKVLALKAIGNAAIDLTIFDLEKIISEPRESPVVRQQAIDALRRLRNQMPRKIQRILLPIFKNTQEQPEVRMTAFSMIMHTIPDKAILDQITYVLFNERSQHVKSFVYTTMKALSQSPVQVEKELARHLETALKIANVEEQQLRGSRFYRVPIYSQEQQEGLFFNWASLFSTNNMLPKHLSLSMDSFLNGLLEKNSFEISLTQTDIENYYQQIFNEVYGSFERSSQKTLRGNRRSDEREELGRDLLDNVFESLKIQPRRRQSEEQTPYGMLCLRIRDIDQIILPLSDETMPEILRDLIKGEKPSISTMSKLLEGQKFRLNTVSSLHERSVKVATTAGLPLKVQHSLPVVGSVEGQIKARIQSEGIKAEIKIQPMISGVHSQKMELWCPMINTGVESLRSVELNLPLESEIVVAYNTEKAEKVKINFRLPQQKTRLVSLNSLPITFTREFDSKIQLHREPKIQTIRNPQMESRFVELTSEERKTVSVNGHFHKPTEMKYGQILALATVTENHITVDFEPLSESPKEIEFTFHGKLFRSANHKSHQPQLESFFSNKKFQRLHEEELEDATLDSESQREQKLNQYLSKYQPNKVYEHTIKAEMKTIGGRKQHQASLELTAVCDNQLTFCKVSTDISRTPMLRHENREWTLSAKTQILIPQSVRQVEQLRENEQDKLVFTVEAEWGSEQAQKLNLKLQGERAVPQQWTRSQWRNQLASAFVNKYDLVADYKLNEWTHELFFRGFDLFKLYNYWNVERTQETQGQEGHIFASLIIDPRTRQHLNMTVKTPSETTRFVNIELPVALKPWTLVRSQNYRQVESVSDVFDQLSESARAECRVDGQKIKTFDQVIYKAPIHQCYSVIAKDCSERKSFVVMMKKLDEQSEDKKIKIVSRENVIEIEPRNEKLSVQVNGNKVEREQFEEYDIDYSEDLVIVQLPQGVSVRFDGQEATVKLSKLYKNSQCGLCGHYDEESDDEFRKNDDSETDDLKEFHKSFSMLEDRECERRSVEKLYEQDSLFGLESSSRRRQQQSNYENTFESDEDADEYEFFEHSRRGQNNEENEDEESPKKQTLVVEYGHKICFSMKAIDRCPQGTYPENTEQAKAQFTCLTRSTETRRLVDQAREDDITRKLSGFKPSFVDTVNVHTACSQY